MPRLVLWKQILISLYVYSSFFGSNSSFCFKPMHCFNGKIILLGNKYLFPWKQFNGTLETILWSFEIHILLCRKKIHWCTGQNFTKSNPSLTGMEANSLVDGNKMNCSIASPYYHTSTSVCSSSDLLRFFFFEVQIFLRNLVKHVSTYHNTCFLPSSHHHTSASL